MFAKILSSTAVVLAATQLVAAQTYTACDPREKSCPPDPAVGKENTVTVDFTKGKNDFFKAADGTTITYDGKGAAFSMKKETEAPTITSTKYIFFGKVDVEAVAAPGQGIVTSIVLQSDDRDEIDWEWIGSDTKQVQTNYFGKGDDSTFDRGGYSPVSNPQSETHVYTIEWTKDYVHWIIDGNLVRELKYADAKGGSRFPQTPAQLKLGTWVAGSSTAPEGTVQWAGGLADFSNGPLTAYYKKVTIQDYAGGVANAKQYVWKDGSDGSWQSIKVETEDGSDGESDDEPTSTSTTAKPTKTATTSADDEETTSSATKTKTTLATVATTTASESASSSAAGHNATPTSDATPTESGAASQTSEAATTSSSPAATGAAFKPGFSGALVGAGVLAALAL
ncbi:concanavalin A-like lectin/glucanase domain-containing protein [Xylaria bambusicola]|uniref:concanavalin A-like lectin/glucanase domain-containing protein n=1 Tax=Xylaria bambusicola TaxID=326684 RepID=UPI002007B0E3|nr:concanavalin A-like lectin/glucanase domain-containing protein [Xylaria bambusicola]KAI0509676.1 concanavalin A-like lectin/glucanase domain-containing protein [Xylaria bambusicola]